MKAMALSRPGGLDKIRRVDVNSPDVPGKNEVKVRVQASSLNYHDLGVAAGWAPVDDGRILLTDGAGVIEQVGEGVTEFMPGDAVVGCVFPQWLAGSPQVSDFLQTPGDGIDGFACEFVTASVNSFTPAPAHFSAYESATIPTAGVTAWRALMVNGPLKAGETVLVQGSGGVSIYALQIAKKCGAKVIATSSDDKKLARLLDLGADYAINYRTHPDWGRLAHDWRKGNGVDHVIDVGGPATLSQSIEASKVGGHIAMVGILGGMTAEVPMISVLAKQIRLQGCLDGSRQDQIDLVSFLEKHSIRPVIDRHFKLEALADAFAYQQSGAHFGKVIINIC